MRITKKFAGASCIGKRVFMPVERTPENLIETNRSRRDLEEMARKFHIRLESMRPGAGGRSGPSSSGKGSLVQSSPKTRRSTSQAAGGAGAGAGGGGGGATLAASGGAGVVSPRSIAGSAEGMINVGDGDGGDSGDSRGDSRGVAGREGGGRTASRSPSPGAHGPHSACDDSAPHPEGSPSHRSSWERDDGEGYGQYDPMDQSPSVDSDASSCSSSRAPGYSTSGGVRLGAGGGLSGVVGGGYGAAAAAAAAAGYGAPGGASGHMLGYAKCRCEGCLAGGSGGGGGGKGHAGFGGHTHMHHQQQQPQGQQQGQDTFHRHGARRPYNFQFTGSGGGGGGSSSGGDADVGDVGGGEEEGGSGGGGGGGQASPMSTGSARVGAWGGRASPAGAFGGALGEPRTLPPAALAATVIREGGGGGSGARSPTWPLPRVIPEGSEISDHDAGGLLLGFFRSVHEKVATAADELEEVRGIHCPVLQYIVLRSIYSNSWHARVHCHAVQTVVLLSSFHFMLNSRNVGC